MEADRHDPRPGLGRRRGPARRAGRPDQAFAGRLETRAAARRGAPHALHRAQISAKTNARRRKTVHPDQLALLADGQTDRVYGYSFIATDITGQTAVGIEHFHRHRAQIEERLKDAKLGQALRRMPSADHNANRTWITACLLALNLAALVCDLSPAAGASGKAPADAPLRRAAKTLRRLFFCVPARIITSARRTTLRLPAGCRHRDLLAATYHAVLALPPP